MSTLCRWTRRVSRSVPCGSLGDDGLLLIRPSTRALTLDATGAARRARLDTDPAADCSTLRSIHTDSVQRRAGCILMCS